MGAKEGLHVRTALQVVSYLPPWEDTASLWNGWAVLTGWMKLLRLELGQDSGFNTSSPIQKMPGHFHYSQALHFSRHLKDVGEEKKRTPSVEMHTQKHIGLVQLWAGKHPARQIAGFPVSFFSHAPLTLFVDLSFYTVSSGSLALCLPSDFLYDELPHNINNQKGIPRSLDGVWEHCS